MSRHMKKHCLLGLPGQPGSDDAQYGSASEKA
jgi:hypothetical protein